MEDGVSTGAFKCYQCEGTLLAYTEETAKDGWLRCDRCGERGVLTADFTAGAAHDKERTIRDKLGVDEFLRTRRINDKAAKTD